MRAVWRTPPRGTHCNVVRTRCEVCSILFCSLDIAAIVCCLRCLRRKPLLKTSVNLVRVRVCVRVCERMCVRACVWVCCYNHCIIYITLVVSVVQVSRRSRTITITCNYLNVSRFTARWTMVLVVYYTVHISLPIKQFIIGHHNLPRSYIHFRTKFKE